jgi:hypothetical protein
MTGLPPSAEELEKLNQRDEALQQLNYLLKKSNYFNDIIQTHRAATERVIASLITSLTAGDPIREASALQGLKDAEAGTGQPSLDTEVRRLVRGIRAELQNPAGS